MDALQKAMSSVITQREQTEKRACSTFIEQLRTQLPSLLHPSQLHTDGSIYLPIQEGCASDVLQLLETYSIHSSNMISHKNKCIRIALTDDRSQIHAVPLSYSCKYVKRIFNQ